MFEKNINLELFIQPENIKKNMKSKIITFLRQRHEKTVTSKYGIIYKVIKIEKIIESKVNNIDSSIFLLVNCLCLIFQPEIGYKLSLPIKKIYPYGIYLEMNVGEKILMKIIIANEDKNYNKEGDEITFEISNIRLEDSCYNVIGKQVESLKSL